jgi:hypothetical protein
MMFLTSDRPLVFFVHSKQRVSVLLNDYDHNLKVITMNYIETLYDVNYEENIDVILVSTESNLSPRDKAKIDDYLLTVIKQCLI